jgi:opacity protein-like surface antigen
MMVRRLVGIAAMFLALTGSASAQDERPVSVNVGGGFTIPYSDLKDAFGTGANLGIGVHFRVSPMLVVQAQYGYNRLGSKDLTPTAGALPTGVISSIPLTANHKMHDGDFNLLIGPSLTNRAAAPYGLVGVGIYHRSVNISTPAVGLGTVCDPWLLICYPTPVPVDRIVGERSTNDFGFNIGGGVSAKLGGSASFYAEVRYIHTNGPSFTDAGGVSRAANGNYFPITFGVRFFSGN